jgi:hypothetical protein
MGLLDEAIKDHLELKRRHGADPGEVARLEHEALGPARREPVAEAPADDEPVAAAQAEAAAVAEPEAPAAAPAAPDDDYEADEVTADERLEAPRRHVEPAPEREPEPEPEPEPEAAIVDQPTAQYSLEELEEASALDADEEEEPEEPARAEEPDRPHADVVPADEEPEGDDVLEETPEFLQETPEHDRLWFEQKPPRDFDF